jgi:hypothetical protein
MGVWMPRHTDLLAVAFRAFEYVLDLIEHVPCWPPSRRVRSFKVQRPATTASRFVAPYRCRRAVLQPVIDRIVERALRSRTPSGQRASRPMASQWTNSPAEKRCKEPTQSPAGCVKRMGELNGR